MMGRHKHPIILARWIAALGRAQPVLGLNHWDVFADVVDRLVGIAPDGSRRPEHAEARISHTPETGRVALSMLAIRHRVDLDFLAAHELAHLRLDEIKERLCFSAPIEKSEAFRVFEESVCDLIAQCIRRARRRNERQRQ